MQGYREPVPSKSRIRDVQTMKPSHLNLICLFGALRGCEGLWKALPSSASAKKKAALCVEEDPALFTQCPVEEPSAAWGDVNLTWYKAQWDAARSSVPALTAMCKGGGWTKYPCRTFGALDWEGKPGQPPKRVVIDTDMANEVDDFPAVVWALLLNRTLVLPHLLGHGTASSMAAHGAAFAVRPSALAPLRVVEMDAFLRRGLAPRRLRVLDIAAKFATQGDGYFDALGVRWHNATAPLRVPMRDFSPASIRAAFGGCAGARVLAFRSLFAALDVKDWREYPPPGLGWLNKVAMPALLRAAPALAGAASEVRLRSPAHPASRRSRSVLAIGDPPELLRGCDDRRRRARVAAAVTSRTRDGGVVSFRPRSIRRAPSLGVDRVYRRVRFDADRVCDSHSNRIRLLPRAPSPVGRDRGGRRRRGRVFGVRAR